MVQLHGKLYTKVFFKKTKQKTPQKTLWLSGPQEALGNTPILAGVRALILVGLERVANLEQLMQLEFGRGFTYNRPLRLNLLDLDYELAEQLVRFTSPHKDQCRCHSVWLLKTMKSGRWERGFWVGDLTH